MDVETAYLNALLEEELYMEAPDGVSKRGAGGGEFFWQVHRSLYGLRQSAFNWNATISEFFVEIDFVAACPSPCVFVRRRGGSSIPIIVLYVDDLLLTGNNEPELQLLKMEIGGRFRVQDLGEAAHLLGMRVSRDDAAERCASTKRTISETWPLATAWRRPIRRDCRRTPTQPCRPPVSSRRGR
ncbi:unnamed protein product, partial [Phaeothamnion confervicola]